ncbi:uncharacterized protein UDID_18947 [Ustilago sp. UG-2017a]|nr:uncharacterized protein UDID_18947 [Ustilago sp. UG-2017a]
MKPHLAASMKAGGEGVRTRQDPYGTRNTCVKTDTVAPHPGVVSTSPLGLQLDEATAEGDISTNLGDPDDTSQLESPQFGLHNDYTLSRPKSPNSEMSYPLALHSYTAFAMGCATKPTTEALDNHLD